MPTQTSAPVVVGRVLLVGLRFGQALVAGLVLGRVGDRFVNEAKARYVCPMHPEVTALGSGGTCPICRMALERVKSTSIVSGNGGRMQRKLRRAHGPAPALLATLSLQTGEPSCATASASRGDIPCSRKRSTRRPALEAQGLGLGRNCTRTRSPRSRRGEHGQFFLANAPTRGFDVRAIAGAEPASGVGLIDREGSLSADGALTRPTRAGLVGLGQAGA